MWKKLLFKLAIKGVKRFVKEHESEIDPDTLSIVEVLLNGLKDSKWDKSDTDEVIKVGLRIAESHITKL